MNFRKNPFRDNACNFKEKSAFKIVRILSRLRKMVNGGPVVASSRSVCDCLALLAQAHRVSALKNCLAIATMTVSMVLLVQAGYDFGFKVVEILFQQSRDCAQGVVAQFSLIHIVYPVMLGILFATRMRLRKALKIKWLLFLSVGSVIVYDSLLNSDIDFRVGAAVLTAVCALGSYAVASLNRFRFRISELQLPDLWNLPVLVSLLTCASICTYVSGERLRFIPVQILCYGTAFFLVTLLYKTKSNLGKANLQLSLLVLLPIIVCNALNIVLNIFSLVLDRFGLGADLSWRALVSAILINGVAFTGIALGAKWPLRSRKRIGRRKSIVKIS